MNKKCIFVLLICLCSLANPLIALDKAEASKYLKTLLKDITTLSFTFEEVSNKKTVGSVQAVKGNKYKIITEGRSIYCDGEKIWNYTRQDNKVLVSQFDANRPNFSIESIFFGLVDKMEIEQFSKELSTKLTKGLYMITFKPDKDFAKKNKISKIKIWMNESKEIQYVAIENNNNMQQWKINKLKVNTKLKSDNFKFTTPKDCKVIELD